MKYSSHIFFALIVYSTVLDGQELSQDSAVAIAIQPLPWTSTRFSTEDIRRSPSRSLNKQLQLVPGITFLNGGLYGRGSRDGQIAYRMNGISALDRFSNTNRIPFIPEALEEVIVHTGAYGAQLGSNAGGSVEMKMREGGESWEFTAKHLTDDFAATGKRFLDTYSYGQHTSVFTIGGPLPSNTRLFVAAELHRQRDRSPMYIEPFEYTFVTSPSGSRPAGTPFPGPFRFVNNHVPSTSEDRATVQWNITSPFFGPQVRFWGSVMEGRNRSATLGTIVQDYFRQRRIPWRNEQSASVGGNMEHELLDWLKIEGSILFTACRNFTTDPDFGENWWDYSDSLANTKLGYSGFSRRYEGPNGYLSTEWLNFYDPNTPTDTYEKRSASVFQSQLVLKAHPFLHWTTQLAWEMESSVLRKYRVSYSSGLRRRLDWNEDGVNEQILPSGFQGTVDFLRSGGIRGYGYDEWGHETETAPFGPRRPSANALVLDNVYSEGPLRLEFGLRGEWFSDHIPMVNGLQDSKGTHLPFDYSIGVLPISSLSLSSVRSFVLPRISISYSGYNSRMFVALGAYADVLPYDVMHIDHLTLSGLLDPSRRASYTVGGPILPQYAVPERTEMFEAGGEWSPVGGVILSGAVFTKFTPNQVEMGRIDVDTFQTDPIGYVNRGVGRSIGGEVSARLNWSKGVRLLLHYAYLDATGRNSSARGNQVEIRNSSLIPLLAQYPVEYQKKHRVLGQLHFTAHPESPLAGTSLLLTAKLESGHPYSPMPLPSGYGGPNIWTWGIQYLSPYFAIPPIETQNGSQTPWTSTLDLSVEYEIDAQIAELRLVASILNLLDTKNAENVYATTGNTSTDGLLQNPRVEWYRRNVPGFLPVYRDLNYRNRWAYANLSGNDLFSSPRQLRLGVEVEL